MADISTYGRLSSVNPDGVLYGSPWLLSGKVIYVSSTNGSSANNGLTRDTPKATLAQGLALVSTSISNVIILMSGHAETLSTALQVHTITSAAGIMVVSEGVGTAQATFTCTGTGSIAHWPDRAKWIGVKFVMASGATGVGLDIQGAASWVVDCTFNVGATGAKGLTVSSTTAESYVGGCTFTAGIAGAGNGLSVTASADGLLVRNCTFTGGSYGWASDIACLINSDTGTLEDFRMEGLTLANGSRVQVNAGAKGYIAFADAEDCGPDCGVDWDAAVTTHGALSTNTNNVLLSSKIFITTSTIYYFSSSAGSDANNGLSRAKAKLTPATWFADPGSGSYNIFILMDGFVQAVTASTNIPIGSTLISEGTGTGKARLILSGVGEVTTTTRSRMWYCELSGAGAPIMLVLQGQGATLIGCDFLASASAAGTVEASTNFGMRVEDCLFRATTAQSTVGLDMAAATKWSDIVGCTFDGSSFSWVSDIACNLNSDTGTYPAFYVADCQLKNNSKMFIEGASSDGQVVFTRATDLGAGCSVLWAT